MLLCTHLIQQLWNEAHRFLRTELSQLLQTISRTFPASSVRKCPSENSRKMAGKITASKLTIFSCERSISCCVPHMWKINSKNCPDLMSLTFPEVMSESSFSYWMKKHVNFQFCWGKLHISIHVWICCNTFIRFHLTAAPPSGLLAALQNKFIYIYNTTAFESVFNIKEMFCEIIFLLTWKL